MAALLLSGCFSPVAPGGDGADDQDGGESDQTTITPEEAPITLLGGQVVIDNVPDYSSFDAGTAELRAVSGGQTSTTSLGTATLDGTGSFTFDPMPTADLSGEGWQIDQFPLTRQYRFPTTGLGEIGTPEVTGILISDTGALFLATHLVTIDYTYFAASRAVAPTVGVSFNTAFGTEDGSITEYWIYVDRDVTVTGTGTATGLDADAGNVERDYNVKIDLLLKAGWNRATVIKTDSDSFRWYTGPSHPDSSWRQ